MTVASFNPSAPGVLGAEWPVTVESGLALASASRAGGAAVLSGAAETIDKASVYVSAVVDTARYVMEVVPVATSEDPVVTTFTARPNEDVAAGFYNVKNQAGGTSNLYQAVDESTIDRSDYLTSVAQNDIVTWQGRVAVGVGNFTGKKIVSVRLKAVVQAEEASTSCLLGLVLGGAGYQQTFYAGTAETTLTQELTYNPSTGLPWTIADVEALDVTDNVRVSMYSTTTTLLYPKIYQVWLEVDYVTENRLAFGGVDIAATGWKEFNLSTPTGGTTFAKANGTEYLFTVRRLYGTGSLTWTYLDSADDPPNGHHAYSPTYSGELLIDLGEEGTGAFALIVTTSAPATSVESQPYADLRSEAVYAGRTVEQEFTGVVANYGYLRAVVAQQALTSDADLLVKVRRRSDNVQVGTTITITSTDLTDPALVTTLREIASSITPVTLAAVQYYLEFSSTATAGTGWVVAVLDSLGSGQAATFDGTASAATVAGVESTSLDVAATFSVIPSTPTSFAASVLVQVDTGHSYVHLTHDPTVLGAGFDRYEYERNDGGTWTVIGRSDTEASNVFNDYESMRNAETSYRMRVFHVNGAASAYSGTVMETAPDDDGKTAFVSNEDPSLNVALWDLDPRTYKFIDERVFHELYGVDGAVEFSPTEDRYEEWDTTLLVGSNTKAVGAPRLQVPDAVGRRAFDRLETMAKAQVSYVAVLDSDGNRWYSSVVLAEGMRKQGRYYSAQIRIREIQRTPSVPEISP